MKGAKLRLLFGAMTAGMTLSALMTGNLILVVNRTMANAKVADLSIQSFLEEIRGAMVSALTMGLVLTLASAVIALLFGLLVSHRFYGPIVPLSRQLNDLAEGRYTARVRLRPGDELNDLAEAQNRLGDALERRHSAPRV